MHKWREFASSDPMQLPCGYTVGLDYSPSQRCLLWDGRTFPASFGDHVGFWASTDTCAITASCKTQTQFLPLLLKSLQKSQWETPLRCDNTSGTTLLPASARPGGPATHKDALAKQSEGTPTEETAFVVSP